MINRKTYKQKLPSFIPKFSDPDLLRTMLNSDIWKNIMLGEKKAKWTILKALLLLKMEMFISPIRAALRFKPGKRTTGITITLLSALMMMAFNADHMIGYACTFVPFIAPIMPFVLSPDQLLRLTMIDIHSVYLMWFWMGYLVLSVIHLSIIYLGKSGPSTDRGVSWIAAMLPKTIRPSTYIIQQFIEPIGVLLGGYALMITETDLTFGIFLMLAGSCLFIQEAYDEVRKFAIRRDPT